MENNYELLGLLGLFANAMKNAQNNNSNATRQNASANTNNPLGSLLQGLVNQNNNSRPAPAQNQSNNNVDLSNLVNSLGQLFNNASQKPAPKVSANNNNNGLDLGNLTKLFSNLASNSNNNAPKAPASNNEDTSNSNSLNVKPLLQLASNLFGNSPENHYRQETPELQSVLNRAMQSNDSVPRQQSGNEANPLSSLLSSILPALSSFASNNEAQNAPREEQEDPNDAPFGNLNWTLSSNSNEAPLNNNDDNDLTDIFKPFMASQHQTNNNVAPSSDNDAMSNADSLLNALGISKGQAVDMFKKFMSALGKNSQADNNNDNNGLSIQL